MRSVAALALAGGVLLVASGCGDDGRVAECPDEGCSIVVTEDVSYADDTLLDVLAPDEPGPWPVVVVAHGLGGSKQSMSLLSRTIAEQGVVVFDLDLPDDPPFLETAEHLACAVRFGRQTADEHGGDPRFVTVVGHSMGAYTGSLVTLAGDDFASEGCVADGGSSSADALVAYEGPYDHMVNPELPFDLWTLEESDPELWSAMDPFQHIGENPDAVVRLIQGVDADEHPFDVHPETAEMMLDALSDAGYEVELTLIDGTGHSIGIPGSPQWEAIVEQAVEVARAGLS